METKQKEWQRKVFFLNKGQLLEGFWVDDINKTGKMIDFDRENAHDVTKYEIPSVNKLETNFNFNYDLFSISI